MPDEDYEAKSLLTALLGCQRLLAAHTAVAEGRSAKDASWSGTLFPMIYEGRLSSKAKGTHFLQQGHRSGASLKAIARGCWGFY